MTILTRSEDYSYKALYQFCELEYRALQNYKNNIQAIKKENYKLRIIEFMNDHLQRIEFATHLLKQDSASTNTLEIKNRQSQSKRNIAKILVDYHHLKGLLINEVETNIMIKGLNSYPL